MVYVIIVNIVLFLNLPDVTHQTELYSTLFYSSFRVIKDDDRWEQRPLLTRGSIAAGKTPLICMS